MSDTKVCRICGETKPISEFSLHKGNIDGRDKRCRVCSRRHNNMQREKQLSTIEGRLRYAVQMSSYRKHFHNITVQDCMEIWRKQKGLCAYTGAPLDTKANSRYTVSLDRKDSKIGYIKDNIQLVCETINIMKQDLSEEEFLTWVYTINAYQLQKDNLKNNGPK